MVHAKKGIEMNNSKFGIALIKQNRASVEQIVMQFGYEERKKAVAVIDRSLKFLDRNTEMLYPFEYPAELQEGLEIDMPLPKFATSDYDLFVQGLR